MKAAPWIIIAAAVAYFGWQIIRNVPDTLDGHERAEMLAAGWDSVGTAPDGSTVWGDHDEAARP